MEIKYIHPLNIDTEKLKDIQTHLADKVTLVNTFCNKDVKLCAGIDVAYWEQEGIEWGVCSIVVINLETRALVEKKSFIDRVTSPYIPGYLVLRELPLILEAVKRLSCSPDLFMFDGNGYLHPFHMGIATHASFFINKPTIGIAKNYYKIGDTDFIMPANKEGAYADIVIKNEVYGRVLRTHQDVKPIFISCGNGIDLETSTAIALSLINHESRLPIPVRLADLESRRHMRGEMGFEKCSKNKSNPRQ
jgi:deoxyribonuclease V